MSERVEPNKWLHATHHTIIDRRMLTLILVSPIAPLLVAGEDALKVFDPLTLTTALLFVVGWLFVGFLIACLVVATGAWVIGAALDP